MRERDGMPPLRKGGPRPPLLPLGEADREALRKILTQTGFLPQKG